MRSRDDVSRRTLRMALAAIQLAQVEHGAEPDDNAILAILQKEIKSRRETIADAGRASRPDLAASAEEEIKVLEAFLPSQMSQEELESLVRQAVAEAGATAPSDMGRVMKILLPRVQGRAPGDQVSKAVRQILQNG